MTQQHRSDHSPFKLTIAAAKGRYGQRPDAPLLVVTLKVLQASNYVAETAHGTPVLLGWEVDN